MRVAHLKAAERPLAVCPLGPAIVTADELGDPPVFLGPGDEVEVEGVGVLSNDIGRSST